MPNHITNWVRIKGTKEKIAQLIEHTKLIRDNDNMDNVFDFNGILPMPPELSNTISPTKVVPTQAEADKLNAAFNANSVVSGTAQRVALTQVEHVRRFTEYGADNWYDWANKNWGTKWGAYEVRYLGGTSTEFAVQFDTAWSSPTPIFHLLTNLGYEVDCIWQDEDPSNEGDYGDPYDAFDIDHPPIEVDYREPQQTEFEKFLDNKGALPEASSEPKETK